MKKQFLKFNILIAAFLIFTACDDEVDDIADDLPETFEEMESDWVRLSLMSDGQIDLMQPNTGEMHGTVTGDLVEGARYYTTNSGRYNVTIDRAGNSISFFDAGIINHEDHGHEQAARWLDLKISAPVPTHVTSSKGHIVVFNDGDGSIIHINESQLELPSFEPTTFSFPNTVAHHGVGFRLESGKFAVTFQSETPPAGYEWGPQMVKFVDQNGNVIDDNGGVTVTGIHGSAVNGTYGAFGATEGVIVVDDKDNIDLIEYPEGFDLSSESGFWLGSLKGHDNTDLFFGRGGNVGAFKIDPRTKAIEQIYDGTDILGDMMSFNGEYYIIQTESNQLIVFDSHDGEEITRRTVEMADIPEAHDHRAALSEVEQLRKMDEPSPVLVTSDEFLYILAPNRTQIKVLEIGDLHHVHTIELDAPIMSMIKNGFSTEGDSDHEHDH